MRIIIVGDGKVGLALIEMLAEQEHEITVIDSNSKVLRETLETYDVMSIRGHGVSSGVLEEAGAAECDLLIAVTGLDEVNLLSCITAKKLGCKNTIARVRNPEYDDQIALLSEELGLSFFTNPEKSCAAEIFKQLQLPSFLERDAFSKSHAEIVRIKVLPESPLIGLPLLRLREITKIRVLVCAALKDGQAVIPHGSYIIEEGDDLFITASSLDLAVLIETLGLQTEKVTQATLVGGSRIALYLARMLLNNGVRVKLIEQDHERCIELAGLLPDANIVEGDGTEQSLLLAEGIERSDALIALTGIDEENIVLSMYAKQLGVDYVITKCNRSQYFDMLSQMGLSTTVSPQQICAEEIALHVRSMECSKGEQMETLHRIADGQVDAMEFTVQPGSALLNTPLSTLPLREGILIACISRGMRAIIPTGSSKILPGDSVVVVSIADNRIVELEDVL
ncbi:MAG: Trk system potassium transporter TrkA [Oscillospiraceae bacterium]